MLIVIYAERHQKFLHAECHYVNRLLSVIMLSVVAPHEQYGHNQYCTLQVRIFVNGVHLHPFSN